jgi:hypothetical protein
MHLWDEILKRQLNLDIFSNSAINKTYGKIIKVVSVLIIYIKFVLLDFNYENNLKGNLRKLLNSVNEQLLSIIENFVFVKESTMEKISKEFVDKYNKIMKNHKIKKSNKDRGSINNIYKNLEIVVNSVKQFSNNFFKIGYFKPIHTICLDFFRIIDSFTVSNLVAVVVNNVLYYILMLASSNGGDKKMGAVSTKTIVFNPSSLLPIGGLAGINTNLSPPFLPSVGSETYTLVLDLDETLVHFFFVIIF